jgi:hypothetical protein
VKRRGELIAKREDRRVERGRQEIEREIQGERGSENWLAFVRAGNCEMLLRC